LNTHKILFLESFYGGSHKAFADGLIRNSKYKIDLLTMPARFWKWRMKGASLYFAEQIKKIEEYDLIFATDLINIAELKVFLGQKCPAIILYFHENQLAYPLNKNEKLDYHYGLADLTNALSADRVIFNSEIHRSTFLKELPLFLNHLPDFVPTWPINTIKIKSSIIYPGIEDLALKKNLNHSGMQENDIPLIIWNHRWEYDKNPMTFFNLLYKLKDEKIPFHLALLGERYKKSPPVFNEALKLLSDNIIHSGYIEDYNKYLNLLKKGDIIISTAIQENYGISVIEAILSGCFPLLPSRLSYPELIPEQFHSEFLYDDQEDLEKKIKKVLKEKKVYHQRVLIDKMSELCWTSKIKEYDNLFEELIIGRNRSESKSWTC
jgi:glycosyltransferase involved in cell wall biosynthesis